MFEHKTEEARKEILSMVEGYYEAFHNNKKEFKEGDRSSYASRVYEQDEMCNVVESAVIIQISLRESWRDILE